MRIAGAVNLCVVLLLTSSLALSQNLYQRTLKLMGSRFDISVVANDSVQGNQFIDIAVNEISRIESLISSWDSTSQTSLINRNAGIRPVEVDPELYNLIERSLHISRLTQGAFDITFASTDRIWHFDGTMVSMPTPDQVAKSVSNVGYQNVILNKTNYSVFLAKKGMRIGFGAIGKGFAADKAKALLMQHGVAGGIVNASGDMNAWGTQPNGEQWRIAITNPFNKSVPFGLLPLNGGALVTSGDYEKFVVFNGKHYSHIINPKTGYPVSGIVSASIFAPKAELADALATAVMVMGVDTGLDFVNQVKGVEAIIVDENGKVFTSKGVQLEHISSFNLLKNN
ncbi:MAG: FAD:protein FMN transferase [Tenuifilaceae bacterium]|jgi:thiamine biosynthesis lipoprotein|nr:FAD:protein FMN transferase [Tenuifilaceae bacterium]